MRHHVPLITVAFFAHWTCVQAIQTPNISKHLSFNGVLGWGREGTLFPHIYREQHAFIIIFNACVQFSFQLLWYNCVLSIIGGLDQQAYIVLFFLSLPLCLQPMYVSHCYRVGLLVSGLFMYALSDKITITLYLL